MHFRPTIVAKYASRDCENRAYKSAHMSSIAMTRKLITRQTTTRTCSDPIVAAVLSSARGPTILRSCGATAAKHVKTVQQGATGCRKEDAMEVQYVCNGCDIDLTQDCQWSATTTQRESNFRAMGAKLCGHSGAFGVACRCTRGAVVAQYLTHCGTREERNWRTKGTQHGRNLVRNACGVEAL